MEHRCGKREKLRRDVRLQTQGGVVARGTICDASLSGAFIETLLPITPLSHIHVLLLSERGPPVGPAVECQVVRHGIGGIGVEWVEFGHEIVRSLCSPTASSSSSDASPVRRAAP
jgi:hypothetical protein